MTISNWLGTPENAELVGNALRQGVQERLALGTTLCRNILEEMMDRFENDPKQFSARDLMVCYGITQDKLDLDGKRQTALGISDEPRDPAELDRLLDLYEIIKAERLRRAAVVDISQSPGDPAQMAMAKLPKTCV
jgi:hypothetical protein